LAVWAGRCMHTRTSTRRSTTTTAMQGLKRVRPPAPAGVPTCDLFYLSASNRSPESVAKSRGTALLESSLPVRRCLPCRSRPAAGSFRSRFPRSSTVSDRSEREIVDAVRVRIISTRASSVRACTRQLAKMQS